MLQTEGSYVQSEKDPHIQEIVLPKPYMWISEDKVSIYYQDGEFYTGRGEAPIHWQDVPEWFWRIARDNYTAAGRAIYGLVLPEDRTKTREEKDREVVTRATKLWKCEEEGCDVEVPLGSKGVHMNWHTNEKKKRDKKIGEKHGKTNRQPGLRQS